MRDEPKITERFRTGEGLGWHEHDGDLFCGTERFFRPGYVANLVPSWLPALDGVEEKLRPAARVADVGCGHGASTIVMAKAFPNSRVRRLRLPRGVDRGGARAPPSAPASPTACASRSPAPRTSRASGYDLVCVFDALHDMGDPVGAAAHVLERARAGRQLADRRADGRRPHRGQPQPGRPDLLLGLDA